MIEKILAKGLNLDLFGGYQLELEKVTPKSWKK